MAARLALILKALGLMIGFSYAVNSKDYISSEAALLGNFKTIPLDLAFFVGAYCFIKKTTLYRKRLFGWFSIMIMPAYLILARLTSAPRYGSYLSAFGILSFSICMLFAPFAAAYSFCDTKIRNPFFGRLTSLSGNELLYLFILGLIAVLSGKVNHEYGLVLIFTGAVGGLTFIMYGRSTFSKLCLSCIAVWMAILVTMTSEKVQTRFKVTRDLASAWDNGNLLSGEATQLYYFFLRVKGAGFYGYGSGQLSKALYPTAENDYAFTTLIYNHGLLTGFLAFFIAVMMCLALLRNESPDRYANLITQSIAIIFGSIYILSFFGNIGSIPLSGISPLFLASAGHSMDAAGAALLGISAALTIKDSIKIERRS